MTEEPGREGTQPGATLQITAQNDSNEDTTGNTGRKLTPDITKTGHQCTINRMWVSPLQPPFAKIDSILSLTLFVTRFFNNYKLHFYYSNFTYI